MKVNRKLGRRETRLGSRPPCGRLGPAITSLLPACSLPCHGDWDGSAPPRQLPSFPVLEALGTPLPDAACGRSGLPPRWVSLCRRMGHRTLGSDAASQSSCPPCAVLPGGASGPRYISRDWKGVPNHLDAAMAGRIYVSLRASSWAQRRKSRRHRKRYRSRRPAAHTVWDWLQDESDSLDMDFDWLPGGSRCQPIQSVYFFVAGGSQCHQLTPAALTADLTEPPSRAWLQLCNVAPTAPLWPPSPRALPFGPA